MDRRGRTVSDLAADEQPMTGGRVSSGFGRRRAGELSRVVLEVLRQEGRPLTAAEVLQRLAEQDVGPLAYTTVVTILSRLHARDRADRVRAGRAYAYLAVDDDARLAARRMRRVLDAEDDRVAVLANFTADLSAHDEQVLRDLLGPGVLPGEAGERDAPET